MRHLTLRLIPVRQCQSIGSSLRKRLYRFWMLGPVKKHPQQSRCQLLGWILTGLFEANNKKQGKGLDFGGEQTELRLLIPRLMWHDSYQNVLWIEDLGNMRSFSEILLDDSTSWERDSENNVRSPLKEIAPDLGTFLARLHATTSNPPTRLVASLTSSSNPDAFHDYLANMVLENLKRPQAGVSGAEARFLADRVRTGLKENAKLAGKDVCFGMVDFWPENVLVDLDITDDDAKDTRSLRSARCGLVDWEYFGPTNAASELGNFFAHLHVHMLNSTTSVLTKDRIQLFAKNMFQAYAECPETTWRSSNSVKQRTLLSHG
ncbi:hypothetical protein CPB84DRAFT_445927 [Gymnopilus junonius]|uniref:Aminoglycoside phosphotransferase domain-containing protein n=1 Tax=Gymnopilus junonius TaxID=109634 RepID=A0A9P5NB77_GYMJU|nr:hypothetical protein CPB84DRAFT_445927 [Gymnopilus junonius]